jgi:hypothetical protein
MLLGSPSFDHSIIQPPSWQGKLSRPTAWRKMPVTFKANFEKYRAEVRRGKRQLAPPI